MKIITSHERADMDALASMYAARLLYPDYYVVLPNKLNRNLRDLLSLYGGELDFVERQELPKRPITHLVLVDTQSIAPLRGMSKATRIHIIDHHTPPEPPPAGASFEGSTVGATATLLTEKLAERQIEPGRLGASLLLMGIYEDTGSLTYGTTTARDARAAAWLLERGADLSLVAEFLHRPLTQEQREVLGQLVQASSNRTIRGRQVCLAAITLQHPVDELSSLIHELLDLYEPEACILLARVGEGDEGSSRGSIQIIARSTTDAIDVAELLREVGGGGHSRAAAALVEHSDLDGMVARLLDGLERLIEPPVLVREIMATNVHTLDLDISVRDAAQMMRRYGHEGFPVVQGHQLVGILTRRDIDRALHHGLGETPIRSYMHTGPAHVRPDDPVDEVQRIMIEHDLGQVPVVEQGRFLGIVTRTDLIKLWSPPLYPSRAPEIRRMMDRALPDPLQRMLLRARDAANDLGFSLYIVGGFVRDLLLGAPTLDLDIVVEGDAIHLARHLAQQLGGRVRSHSRFGTAKIILEGEAAEGLPPSLDLVTARTEFYESPTVLPQVERSSIKQDLYRRDFTINTMAICLDRDRYGVLLDYYGGERDIREGKIRVLHNLSFVEDPTRILRAVRFEQRLGFSIEERTAELIDDALELLDHVSGERLRHELTLILNEAQPENALERLARMGALVPIHPAIRFGRETALLFARLRQRFAEQPAAEGEGTAGSSQAQPEEAEEDRPPDREALGRAYLALVSSAMSAEEVASFSERLRLPESDAHLLYEVLRLRESLGDLQASAMLPSGIYRLLHPYSREARFVLSVLADSRVVRQRLAFYEKELIHVRPSVDGHYLRSLGVPPGPIYNEILGRVRDALLDKQVTDIEGERRLAHNLVEAARNSAVNGFAESGRPPKRSG
ncbi:MAG: CBS domain-containing protein [Anaerolineae bacterium]